MSLEIIGIILSAVSTLTTGGVLTWFIKARYTKYHEEISIKQEKTEVKSHELRNADSVIEMYKKIISDLNAQHESYIQESNRIIDGLRARLEEMEEKSKSQELTIDSLTKAQVKLTLELITFRKLAGAEIPNQQNNSSNTSWNESYNG